MIAAALAAAYLIVQPTGADLPAQLLRTRLFGAEGFGIWNDWWYGGQYVTGYSVLFPPLAWLLGPQLLSAFATVGTAAAFEALTHDIYGDDAWLGATWLGAATVTELVSGRLTFAVGLCGAAVTALLLERRRPRSAAVLAGLTTLASPVAGLLAALAGAVAALAGAVAALSATKTSRGGVRTRFWSDIASGIAAISVCIGLLGVGALVFPEGGYQPFAFSTLWPLLAAGGFVLLLRPGWVLGCATVLYLAGCVAAYLVATPLGSNAARLGELVAGPLVALLLVPRRAWLLLALSALPLTYLQVLDAITDLQHGSRANTAAYYRPLLRFLERQPGIWRVEVPFTRSHWESYWLAGRVPLARGWERQADIADDGLFYGGALTAARYEAWLHSLAVRYVAVAGTAPDYSAVAELRLIRAGLPYLHVVARPAHWTVYEIAHPTAIASGAGRLVSMGPDSLTVAAAHPGLVRLRVRWSPYWQLSGIRGCVMPDGAFTQMRLRSSGDARLEIGFAVSRINSRQRRCN